MHHHFRISLCYLVLVALASFGTNHSLGQATDSTPRRVTVPEVTASSLISQKSPLKYPDAARNAGIQGTVVLRIVVAETGDVKEAAVVSGDPLLSQGATEGVKQWKFKPYTVDGVPVEMETQVSINFHFKSPERTPPSLGTFRNGTYSNDSFNFEYPVSRDWIRETEAIRKKVSAGGQSPGMYVLLAAVHIPQQTAPLEADSSFVLSAIEAGSRNCEQYLKSLADSLHSQKAAQEKGKVSPLTISGRDFYRADLEFRASPSHHTFLCTQSKEYLLQWNILGVSRGAIESGISTLNAIRIHQSSPVTATAHSFDPSAEEQKKLELESVRVSPGVSQGLLIRKVSPIYPAEARYAHIQGSVVMSVIINKNGEVVDLEALDGPIELVVSAVNAVRQWKYRPYTLKGQPVEVQTQITVNYLLSGG